MKKVLVIGTLSDIVKASVQRFIRRGYSIYLIVNSSDKLEDFTQSIKEQYYVNIQGVKVDINSVSGHAQMLAQAEHSLKGLDLALLYQDNATQPLDDLSYQATLHALGEQCLASISLLTRLASFFEKQGHGKIAVISSVSSNRATDKNYVLATAKSALETYLQGLRKRLHPLGIDVVTLKRGFTQQDSYLPSHFGLLASSPTRIARHIDFALERPVDIAYFPWFWRYIVWAVRCIPEAIFKRLNY